VIACAQTPVVSSGGVSNAANGLPTVAPGSLVSIYGSNLAGGLAQADSIPLSTTLSNVSVTFNGVAAPLLFVSTGQINAQLPWNVLSSGTTGTANVVVTRNNQASTAQTLQVGPFSPGIFAINNIAVAINPDGSIAAPVGAIPGIPTRPAKIGDPGGLVILCTGLGAVDSSVANGAASLDKLRTATTTPTVMIGGKAAQVVFAGLSPQFVGVNQINLAIPSGTQTGDAVPIQISLGGTTTSATITIAVSN
jgi:trimeric autotransporter adhesin